MAVGNCLALFFPDRLRWCQKDKSGLHFCPRMTLTLACNQCWKLQGGDSARLPQFCSRPPKIALKGTGKDVLFLKIYC